ncbi:hypothetical protein ACBI99_30500 [Nonomuraea sp. ATR24]|uniref:hypothetical protein n=1 Tax=Nonomuraea sp. ATR24 TaxID=1676744 RepID=UPI0035C1D19D
MSSISRIATIAMAAVALAGGTALTAPPAQAASWNCHASWNEKSFNLPGKPDMTVWARSCVYKDGNTRRARIELRWDQAEPVYGESFDKFAVQVRLERDDTVITSGWCEFKQTLNDNPDGFGSCTSRYVTSSAQYGWTGDGKVVYNINNDGNGDYTWNLHGSGEVKIAPNGLEVGDEPEPEPLPDPADTPEPADTSEPVL